MDQLAGQPIRLISQRTGQVVARGNFMGLFTEDGRLYLSVDNRQEYAFDRYLFDPQDFRLELEPGHAAANTVIHSRIPGRLEESMRIADLIGRRVQVRSSRSGTTYDLEVWGIMETRSSPNNKRPLVVLRAKKYGEFGSTFIEFNFDPQVHEVISPPQPIRNEADVRLDGFKALLTNCNL